jgi:hypothetical protein
VASGGQLPALPAAGGQGGAQAQVTGAGSGQSSPIFEGPLFVTGTGEAVQPQKSARVSSCGVSAPAGSAIGALISALHPGAWQAGSLAGSVAGDAAVAPETAVAADAEIASGATGPGAPTSPAPNPEPGGASGGSATGASSAAPSGTVTLPGSLQIAPERAVRLLQLVSEPWLTTSFVLIPERPD